jgi:hypothetical protein
MIPTKNMTLEYPDKKASNLYIISTRMGFSDFSVLDILFPITDP